MRPKNIEEIKRAIELRTSAGYTLSAIVEQTGISASTLQRHFKALGIARGSLSTETIEQAKEQLLNDAGFLDGLKQQIAASIVDDLSLSKLIRQEIAVTLEQLSDEPPIQKARALAALSTSARLTQELTRKALRADNGGLNEVEDLPTLTICRMSDEETETVKLGFDDN